MSTEPVSFSKIKNALNEAIKRDGVIIKTPDYVFIIYEMAPDRWVKASWIFSDEEGWKTTVSTKRALLYLIEEVTESLKRYEKGEWKPIIAPQEVKTIITEVEG
ncbi:MAG: hypothetical protein GWO20_17420 [Candidatus Korarchaeota archaeon]|nr:hypothetical protein [Candidatus Korarchaeota archaeon]NIU82007.1 hypothetical protein [Candidatus Thorarchaeota archaeon]NIW15175.1 hypothetical protein [Candidatus Thorarchaeota archaeon]NIW53165.1 hypothetical protein [Candidatus Korarchaeota archaeon]